MTGTPQPESAYAWWRLMVSLLLMTIGGAGMYAVTVVLPRVQADFAVDRADASLPYTMTMIGFGFGGILMGRLADRFGVMVPLMLGAIGLGAGFITAGMAGNLWMFTLSQGLLLGLLGAVVIARIVFAFANLLLAPARPEARLLPLDDASAVTLTRAVTTVAALFGLIVATKNTFLATGSDLAHVEAIALVLGIAVVAALLGRPTVWWLPAIDLPRGGSMSNLTGWIGKTTGPVCTRPWETPDEAVPEVVEFVRRWATK